VHMGTGRSLAFADDAGLVLLADSREIGKRDANEWCSGVWRYTDGERSRHGGAERTPLTAWVCTRPADDQHGGLDLEELPLRKAPSSTQFAGRLPERLSPPEWWCRRTPTAAAMRRYTQFAGAEGTCGSPTRACSADPCRPHTIGTNKP